MLASGFEFAPRDSWLDVMAARGYLACGLDFLGFGASSRPPALLAAAADAPPITDAHEAAAQIGLAVAYLRTQRHMTSIHLVAHSWGTIPATAFAAQDSGRLASLTLFGPIAHEAEKQDHSSTFGAWWGITAQERYEQLRFTQVLPAGKVLLESAVDQRWASALEASAPHVPGDRAGELRIPAGPAADIATRWAGASSYAASAIETPVFIVYGNYDAEVDDAGAAALLTRFARSPLKWRLRIDDGTHVMHLETNRRSLYAGVDAFIRAAEARLDTSAHPPL
jgi:pimeloyl-ACP methyl ester carboxylesterase